MTVEPIPYRLRFPRPVRGCAERRGWWLKLTDADGRVGWGEAAPWPGFGSAAGAGQPEIAHAFEVALLDLEGQRRGLPIAKLLHPDAVAQVPTHVLVDDLAEARAAIAAGARALKVKVDARPLDWLRAVEVPVRLDCNGAGDAAALAAFGPEWIEQPTPPGAPLPAGPIAVDEAITGPVAVAEALAAGARVIVLKPMFLGGLRPTQALARQAWRAGARVCVTHALGSAIERVAARHLAAALLAEAPDTACGLAGQLLDDIAALPPLVDGLLGVPQGPGLGIEVRA